MRHECDKGPMLELMHQDIRDIRKDIRSLLKFRWSVMGGAGVVGAILAFCTTVLVKKIGDML